MEIDSAIEEESRTRADIEDQVAFAERKGKYVWARDHFAIT